MSMAAPDDTGPIEEAISEGRIDPSAILAVFAKTEGNGCVNDFTRAFSVQSLRLLLGTRLAPDALDRIAMVMSGGTEGALAPHWLVLEACAVDAQIDASPSDGEALAIGVHTTPPLGAEAIGRPTQVLAVADGVREAMKEAAIDHPDDVAFVQVKCPLVSAAQAADAVSRGASVRTSDTLKSMGLSRGAAALGVGVALGEFSLDIVMESVIGSDPSLFSSRASCSAGIELMGNEIVVLGRSQHWTGPLTVGSAVMQDALDIDPVKYLLSAFGLFRDGRLAEGAGEAIVAVLAKAEPSRSGRLRGFRHTMLDDSDVSATRHARGFVAGVLGGVIGHAELFVSGGAEHQGPDGGGPVAIIARRHG